MLAAAGPRCSADTSVANRAMNDIEDRLLTESEAAHLLNVSRRCLQGWRSRGGGPPFVRISARCIRYSRADLDRWIDSLRCTSTSDPNYVAD